MSIWFEDMGRILFQVRVNLHHNDSEVFPHKRTRIPKTCILLIYSLMEQYYWLMYACLSKTQITFPMKITISPRVSPFLTVLQANTPPKAA